MDAKHLIVSGKLFLTVLKLLGAIFKTVGWHESFKSHNDGSSFKCKTSEIGVFDWFSSFSF